MQAFVRRRRSFLSVSNLNVGNGHNRRIDIIDHNGLARKMRNVVIQIRGCCKAVGFSFIVSRFGIVDSHLGSVTRTGNFLHRDMDLRDILILGQCEGNALVLGKIHLVVGSEIGIISDLRDYTCLNVNIIFVFARLTAVNIYDARHMLVTFKFAESITGDNNVTQLIVGRPAFAVFHICILDDIIVLAIIGRIVDSNGVYINEIIIIIQVVGFTVVCIIMIKERSIAGGDQCGVVTVG